ncbi:hypothetical protein [Gelidibacter mesophilus]|uniref:hypothetical protein n=1 Tax=Gelidibacter mesophilus TaxID=169050 RepID=UPI0004143171|nr:hypothetical protein [Gelidibacter mesophilus]
MKKLTTLLLVLISLQMNSQINCIPTIGDGFKPITKGIALRDSPELTSEIVMRTPSANGIWLKSTENGYFNDFVKVKVWFIGDAYKENGVNSNISYLYTYLKDDYGYDFNFQDYIKYISDNKNLEKIYNTLISDENNDWFKDWSNSEKYDVSTFNGFYDYWIYFDKEKSNYNYIFENEGKELYVNKNDLTNDVPGLLYANGQDVEFYLEKINELIDLNKNRKCEYLESKLIFCIEKYISLLSDDNAFKAIQEINTLSEYISDETNKRKLEYLKMIASYKDENFIASIKIGKELINSYDKKLINNYQVTFSREDIDMSEVYGYVISSLISENKLDEAFNLSLKSLNNQNLQFGQNIEFHSIILLQMNKKSEACELLNKEYLNGNEKARELINKYCK